jgi:CheY-like chemotaxis protein
MKTVLLIEDDATFRFLGQTLLQRIGIGKDDIATASNGIEALELLNNYYSGARALPDIILLDINMPILDGFGFLEAFLRLDLPNKGAVKIVVVTSSTNSEDIRRAMEMGASDYLTKPLTVEMLMDVLEFQKASSGIA